jgi:ER membrane protein complex subunit 2
MDPRYTRSLQALSHVLLLAPQNPFHVLHFAETAYTANDVPLAIRYFLRAIELCDADNRGVARRAWFGVRLVSNLLPVYDLAFT